MSLCTFDKEILRSNIGHIVLESYMNKGEEPDIENVEKRLAEKLSFTDEMRREVPPIVAEWVQHLNRKRDEYIIKSKYVTWLNDATYDLEIN